MRRLRSNCLILGGLCTVACFDKEPITAPTIVRANPSYNMQSLAPFFGDLPVTGSSTLSLPSFGFNEGVKVEIKIEGQVGVVSDYRAPYVNAATLSLDAKGVWVGGVYNRCYVSAHVSYPSSPGPRTDFNPGNGCVIPHAMQNYIDTGVVRGAGTAIRDAKVPEEHMPCDTIVCHTYSGTQSITITPLQADLDYQGTFAGVRSSALFLPKFTLSVGYHQVIFTDSTIPRGMPLQPLQHTWTYADPTDPGHWYWHKTDMNQCPNYTPPLYPSAYCAINIKETGIMTSRARVNGVEHVGSVTAYCADSIALLNNDLVRQGMLAVLTRRNYTPSRSYCGQNVCSSLYKTLLPREQNRTSSFNRSCKMLTSARLETRYHTFQAGPPIQSSLLGGMTT